MTQQHPVVPGYQTALTEGDYEAVIRITNLRLRTRIGFNPDELEKPQDVIINCEIRYRARRACLDDDELEALDYKVITKQVIQLVEGGQFRLLEKLTADILTLVLGSEGVKGATVTVDKPHALRFADSVSVTLSGSR